MLTPAHILHSTCMDPDTGEIKWPKLWHPETGIIQVENARTYPEGVARFETDFKDIKFDGGKWVIFLSGILNFARIPERLRLVLKSFDDLAKETEANPKDNVLSRYFEEPCYASDFAHSSFEGRFWNSFIFEDKSSLIIPNMELKDHLRLYGYNVDNWPDTVVISPNQIQQ